MVLDTLELSTHCWPKQGTRVQEPLQQLSATNGSPYVGGSSCEVSLFFTHTHSHSLSHTPPTRTQSTEPKEVLTSAQNNFLLFSSRFDSNMKHFKSPSSCIPCFTTFQSLNSEYLRSPSQPKEPHPTPPPLFHSGTLCCLSSPQNVLIFQNK